jgi:hypothetical protein
MNMKEITVKLNATGRYVLRNRLEDADARGRELGKRIQKNGIMEPITFTVSELQYLNDIAQNMNHNQTNGWLNTKLRLRRSLREECTQ